MTNNQTTQWPFVKAGVAGVVLRGKQILMVRRKYGSNKGKWCIPLFFPLDRPPTEMAFEADKKIIEQLKGSSL